MCIIWHKLEVHTALRIARRRLVVSYVLIHIS